MNRDFRRPALALLALSSLLAIAPGAASAGEPGLDLAGMDKSTKPVDDFFRFANGAWYDATEIPADRVAIGSFQAVDDLATEQLKSVIEGAAQQAAADPKAAEAQKIADYYAAYMDEATIEKRG